MPLAEAGKQIVSASKSNFCHGFPAIRTETMSLRPEGAEAKVGFVSGGRNWKFQGDIVPALVEMRLIPEADRASACRDEGRGHG